MVVIQASRMVYLMCATVIVLCASSEHKVDKNVLTIRGASL